MSVNALPSIGARRTSSIAACRPRRGRAAPARRDEARARLVAALRDFDLVLAGGATNKGYLIELLETPELRAGGVDTAWLDRRAATEAAPHFAAESLLAAAIVAYQRRRRDARLNFYADTTNATPARVPPSVGQEIELSHQGARYRLQVAALGSWRYRVQLDGRATSVKLREGDPHVALLSIGERTVRILHDETELGVRVEVEGHAHRFGWQTAGEVRAATPAMVVALHVQPGDAVEAGQSLGLLEAMKMEIGFAAPVAGVVTEVRVRAGQRVAAGDALVVIDPAADSPAAADERRRLEIPDEPDALGASFAGEPARIEKLREEVRGALLGYDADAERLARLATLLEAQVSSETSSSTLAELARLRSAVILFADVEQLFVRAPRLAESGRAEPSNDARLRVFVRRMRAAGAGLAEDFTALLRAALSHYGIADLTHDDALERAVMRMFASRHSAAGRHRLLREVLRLLAKAARSGSALAEDAAVEDALARIAAMRDLVGDELADVAIETTHVIFVEPATACLLEHASGEIEASLRAAESGERSISSPVVLELAEAPYGAFRQVVALLGAADGRSAALALSACLHRFHAGRVAELRLAPEMAALDICLTAQLADGRRLLVCRAPRDELQQRAAQLLRAAHAGPEIDAVELFVAGDAPPGGGAAAQLATALGDADGRVPAPLVVSWVGRDHGAHWTFAAAEGRYALDERLHELHPESALRLGLARLAEFELERLPAPEGIYCFHGRSRGVPADERIFVLGEVRGRSARRGGQEPAHVAAFERAFQEAARTLRATLATRDPERRLQWNRIVLAILPELRLSAATTSALARRLASATHRLGLDRVLVRLTLLDGAVEDPHAREIELVVTNVTGRHLEITPREPHAAPLVPAARYQRKVVEARRRRLVYPYEIVRMLSEGDGAGIPPGSFEEYDLAAGGGPPRAVSVAGRPPGQNESAIVFGTVRTVTDKVPEGMRRVLILSDPTVGMGSLAAAECDRICAAFDLAEQASLPVEWIPISSGARIAMDSGTENLDATARVVRRIVAFTQRGGVVNLIVYGTNVGAQSYWNALATMHMQSRGTLVMTANAAMVLTGRKALEAAGSVAAEDEVGIGGFEHVMGPNGEAQYYASDLVEAYRLLYQHYRFTYVVPGESAPRRSPSRDPSERRATEAPYGAGDDRGFASIGEIFDDATNPGRKRPFAMRPVMSALIDRDGGSLERWGSWVGAETAIVWEAHLGGVPVCMIGIESENVARNGYRPLDGPSAWSGGTLFPLSSKKVARALNAASGVRPAVIVANLSGFDGSPESMRKLQLEYGAEIARAVVGFAGPLLFLVVSRYHGGAYVVFSKALNDRLRVGALSGSYASVIGGSAAAAVVFTREARARAAASAAVQEARAAFEAERTPETRQAFERAREEALLDARAAIAVEFDAIHSVGRARQVGSLDDIVAPSEARRYLIRALREAAGTAPAQSAAAGRER